MKLKNWISFAGAVLILSSCGENSSTETKKEDSLTSASPSTPSADATPTPSSTPTTTKSVEVPAATRTSFESKYPNASNVTWTYYDEPYSDIDWEWTSWPTVDNKDYYVRYNWEGNDYYSWYDEKGDWIGSTSPMKDFKGLPASVNSVVNKEFNGYNVVSVDKENDKNREAYEIELEKGSDKAKVLIATDGTILKKKTKIDGVKTKEKMK